MRPNEPNWYWLIKKHIFQGSVTDAFLVYKQIRFNGVYILGLVPLLLKACASASIVKHGNSLHGEAIKNGVDFDLIIGTSLVDMYAKFGALSDSRKMFDYMPERNVVTWNAMILGCIRNGDMKCASFLFDQMPQRTEVTWNQMIHGFARTGDFISARCMFDHVPPDLKNVVTWTVMVDGYATKGRMSDARLIFEDMSERNFFAWSSMISGYCRIGDVKEAKAIFDRIPVKNLVNWNSLICGYAQNGFCEEALETFGNMQEDGFEPDEITAVGVLSACAQLGQLNVGKDIHQMLCRKGIKLNQFIVNALVDMYAKCGDLTRAQSIFDGITCKNSACWNSIISGFGIHGKCKQALEFFRRMEHSNQKPNEITFLSLLSACAHGGFVDEGLEIFFKMQKCGLAASIKHYGCVVDLLGRAGRLQDAYDLIQNMPMTPNDAVWGSLLGACRLHSDMNMVNKVLEEINRQPCTIDSDNDSHCVLLSNIYAASDSWEKAERMRMVMMNQGLPKTPGRSSLMLINAEQ
ncbi:pentatricopeptide repeat-containing protein At3g21470 [Euphorbia lathyris]|uniref:pentatricopeptide repeat-containing protein At3g21470 n=1 Tax=Euphorbia lathyris TaxID=212925 RepID=UPI003313E1A7